MKKQLLAATALLAWTALPVLAQDVSAGVSTGVSAGVSAELPSVDASTSVNASGNANANANAGGNSDNTYGSVISSVSASGDLDLTAYTDESKVTIVLLSSLQGNADTEASALDNALTMGDAALTGPIVRGDVETVRLHLEGIVRTRPDTLPAYVALARATANSAVLDGRLLPIRAAKLVGILNDALEKVAA